MLKNLSNVCVLILFLPGSWIMGQSRIELNNPSFEQSPEAGAVIKGWENLGATAETPPDIQPGFFGVNMEAKHGRTYLGLVVRSSNTWEGVGQQLSGKLRKDSSYRFSVWLNRSNTYKSASRTSPNEIMQFNAPTILKIWGYNTQTQEEELLAESQAVGHSKWMLYEFTLKPTLADFDELDLMAYYAPGHEMKNGNLLIDHCSAIELIQR